MSLPAPLAASQTVTSIDAGGSVVEYDGFLVSGAATVTPSIQYDGLNSSAGAQASWVLFESGNSILQFTAAGAWLTNPSGRIRAELSGSFGLGQYRGSSGYGHLLGRTRVHYVGKSGGGWLGLGGGVSFGDYEGTPVELAIGGWSVIDQLGLAGSITTTSLNSGQYVDVMGAARWTSQTLRLETRVGARGFSGGEGGGVYGEMSVLYNISSRIGITAGGGRYRTDPARGVIGAKYVNLGVRLNITRSRPSYVPTISRALSQVDSELTGSSFASPARLEVQNAGSRGILLIHSEASRVEVMADFTDWVPVALQRVGSDVWEFPNDLPSGVHRLNVRINGGPWLVPVGARLEENEFGGAVGIIVIPTLR